MRHGQKQTEVVAFQHLTVDSAHLQHCVTLCYIKLNVHNNNVNNNVIEYKYSLKKTGHLL